jgi:hypothetical protein
MDRFASVPSIQANRLGISHLGAMVTFTVTGEHSPELPLHGHGRLIGFTAAALGIELLTQRLDGALEQNVVSPNQLLGIDPVRGGILGEDSTAEGLVFKAIRGRNLDDQRVSFVTEWHMGYRQVRGRLKGVRRVARHPANMVRMIVREDRMSVDTDYEVSPGWVVRIEDTEEKTMTAGKEELSIAARSTSVELTALPSCEAGSLGYQDIGRHIEFACLTEFSEVQLGVKGVLRRVQHSEDYTTLSLSGAQIRSSHANSTESYRVPHDTAVLLGTV